ncbi:hypothetical protein PoB_006517200 [Plakobranchus ocellatus]|uniref:Uncharacterized protein n=1 Tax=Plakobranchus ocellatus TaxID=259542 RepID=A0AAV4D3B1_9GAST|nr:hypothetical protein PoB_006517200 [Plakobranchus ocellatus]
MVQAPDPENTCQSSHRHQTMFHIVRTVMVQAPDPQNTCQSSHHNQTMFYIVRIVMAHAPDPENTYQLVIIINVLYYEDSNGAGS